MSDLTDYLEEMHLGAIAVMVGGSSPVHYLNQLAAAQDELARCALAHRMREAVEADGLKLEHGAYNFLLEPRDRWCTPEGELGCRTPPCPTCPIGERR